jgi:hypothetical protein
MSLSAASSLSIFGVLLLAACGGSVVQEGQEPYSCRDGADNDGDGQYDCDDNGCWNSPDCVDDTGEPDTDTDSDSDSDSDGDIDTDTDGDTDTDTDTGISDIYDLTTVSLEYTVTFDIDDTWEDIMCDTWDVCDCTSTYQGDGTQVEVVADRLTLYGLWKLASSDCSDSFKQAIWVDVDEVAQHSFIFDAGMTELDDWIVHADLANYEPESSPLDHEQFFIIHMDAPWSASTKTVHHNEMETQYLDDIIPYFVTSDVTFIFNGTR